MKVDLSLIWNFVLSDLVSERPLGQILLNTGTLGLMRVLSGY